jgi:phage terminase large subunit GpA-like protein
VYDPQKNKWVLRKGRRNEALDCFVYATAAGHNAEVRVHAKRPAEWGRLAKLLEGAAAPVTEAAPDKPQRKKPHLPSRVRR